MSGRERVYRLMLRAFPTAFRRQYEQEMLLVFRDLQRERRSAVGLWSFLVWDIVRSAPTLRLQAYYARWNEQPHHNGAIMKTMAIVAMFVGVITLGNASIEGWLGAVGNHDPQSLVAWVLGTLGGASMVLAGVLLFRRTPGALTRAQVAAVACLAAFVLMLVISPRNSIAANILGIGTPLLLVAFVQFRRNDGRPTPTMG